MEQVDINITTVSPSVDVNITQEYPQVNLNVICNPTLVKNSNNSFEVSIESGSTYILPDIVFTDSDQTISHVPSVVDITAKIGGDNVVLLELNTGALTANVTKTIEHNLGSTMGATVINYDLCELNGQKRGYNEFYPDPSFPLDKLILTVGDDNPDGLIIKIEYQK